MTYTESLHKVFADAIEDPEARAFARKALQCEHISDSDKCEGLAEGIGFAP